MEEKIKTWPLRFPAKEDPSMEKALFDWPIVLQYDVKAKHRLISRKFSGIKFFPLGVRLTNQKPRAFVSVVVNFLFQLIFIFPLFWGMVMYANEFKTKEKQKLTEIKN